MSWSKFHYFYANCKRARASYYYFQKECLKDKFILVSFETIDLSENKQHKYLNALNKK